MYVYFERSNVSSFLVLIRGFYSHNLQGPGSENPRKRKSEESAGGWFDIEDEKNHNIYIWGLPLDITLEEFTELMSKYGIIMEDDDGGCGLVTLSLSWYMYCICLGCQNHPI